MSSAQVGVASRRSGRARSRRAVLLGLAFISPWILGFLIFTLLPTLASAYYSFTRYSILQPPRWVGLDNFVELLGDAKFWKAMQNTLYMVFVGLPIQLTYALGMALLLNQRVRALGLFRTIFYLPSLMPGIAVAYLFMLVLTPKYGLLDSFLINVFDVRAPRWWVDPTWSKPGLILINLWGVGTATLFYLAALQDMPKELYEAADLDGANGLRKFLHITFPMLTPITLFNLLTGIIAAFQAFLKAYVISDGIGKPLESTLMYSLYLFNTAFTSLRLGYASAIAWVLLLVVLAVTVIILRTSKGWVYYAGEGRSG